MGSGKVRVRVNPKFYRPVENEDLLGSYEKAKKAFGWEPKYNLESLVEEMVLSDIELVKSGNIFSSTYLDWLVVDAETTVDSGIGSAKGSDWSVAGSEKTEDLGVVTNDKHPVAEDLNGQDGLDHVVDKKPLNANGETNGHLLEPVSCN